jgi:hypothetical protein
VVVESEYRENPPADEDEPKPAGAIQPADSSKSRSALVW